MTTEERLIAALRATDDYEPNPDLYARVVHSIEEDRLHRVRVRSTSVAVGATTALLVAVAALSVETARVGGALRHRIDWRMLEALETIALATLVVVLGPAIRRFGRGYVGDILAGAAETGTQLLRLVDLAYYLVFSGYVLVTARFAAPVAYHLHAIGDQVEESVRRVGGLLLIMGLLHALTLAALPFVGLVFTANRRGAKLPRWITVLAIAAAVVAAWQLTGLAAGLVALGSG